MRWHGTTVGGGSGKVCPRLGDFSLPRAQMSEVYLFGLGTVLRLEGMHGQWLND